MIIEVWRNVVKPHVKMWVHDRLSDAALGMYRKAKEPRRPFEFLSRFHFYVRLADKISTYAVHWLPWNRDGHYPQLNLRLNVNDYREQGYKLHRSRYPWGEGPTWQIFWHKPLSFNHVKEMWEVLPKASQISYANYDGYRGGTVLLWGYGLTVERYGYNAPGDCKQFWSD